MLYRVLRNSRNSYSLYNMSTQQTLVSNLPSYRSALQYLNSNHPNSRLYW